MGLLFFLSLSLSVTMLMSITLWDFFPFQCNGVCNYEVTERRRLHKFLKMLTWKVVLDTTWPWKLVPARYIFSLLICDIVFCLFGVGFFFFFFFFLVVVAFSIMGERKPFTVLHLNVSRQSGFLFVCLFGCFFVCFFFCHNVMTLQMYIWHKRVIKRRRRKTRSVPSVALSALVTL